MDVRIADDTYVLSLPVYDSALIEFCRSLQKSRYNPIDKTWSATRNLANAIDLSHAGYYQDEPILANIPKQAERGTYHWALSGDLYKHQVDWTRWSSRIAKAMLCAEMGLGKTFMAIQWAAEHGIKPDDILVVCPLTLISHWAGEFKKFAGVEATKVTGTPLEKRRLAAQPGCHIINYESFTLSEQLAAAFTNKTCVILDESHKIKNPSTQRSKKIHAFCSNPKRQFVLCLTGTPVSQGLQDYFSQFRVINPSLLGSSFTAFKHRYCIQAPVRGAPAGIMRIIGYRNIDELNRIIAPHCRTYLKKDCLDLPEKTYAVHYVQMGDDQKKHYRELRREMATTVGSEIIAAPNILARLTKLSQIAQGFLYAGEDKEPITFESQPKLDALQDIIEGLPPKAPLVIMAVYLYDIRSICRLLEHLGIKFGVIKGDIPNEMRHREVEKFQSGEYQILVGQITTVGLGLSLTRSDKIVFYSNTYSYTDRKQAEDRIHRIGTTSDRCLYIDLVTEGTIDEQVMKAIRAKKDVADMMSDIQSHLTNEA